MHALRTRAAFTLVELLAVIAILAILASVVTVAVTTARQRVQSAQCQVMLREVGTAMHLHILEHTNRLPSNSHVRDDDGGSLSWTRTLETYLGPRFLGRCPVRPDHPARITYGWNDLLTDTRGAGLSFAACRNPSSTLAVAELGDDQIAEHFHFRGAARGRVTPAFFRSEVATRVHGASSNYLFVDGHVASIPDSAIPGLLAAPQPPFLFP